MTNFKSEEILVRPQKKHSSVLRMNFQNTFMVELNSSFWWIFSFLVQVNSWMLNFQDSFLVRAGATNLKLEEILVRVSSAPLTSTTWLLSTKERGNINSQLFNIIAKMQNWDVKERCVALGNGGDIEFCGGQRRALSIRGNSTPSIVNVTCCPPRQNWDKHQLWFGEMISSWWQLSQKSVKYHKIYKICKCCPVSLLIATSRACLLFWNVTNDSLS